MGKTRKFFFAQVDSLFVMMSAAGIVVPEKKIVRTIVRQLLSDLDMEKRSTPLLPGLSRQDIEKTIRDLSARRKATEFR